MIHNVKHDDMRINLFLAVRGQYKEILNEDYESFKTYVNASLIQEDLDWNHL